MAAAIPWIIAAASAAGAGSQVAGAAGAGQRVPTRHTVKLPAYIEELQRYAARYLGQNMTAQPPSFIDYLKSGGTATFGTPAAMSPVEAAGLGIYGKHGRQIPFIDPVTGRPTVGGPQQLSPEQLLFLADAYKGQKRQEAAKETRKQALSGLSPSERRDVKRNVRRVNY